MSILIDAIKDALPNKKKKMAKAIEELEAEVDRLRKEQLRADVPKPVAKAIPPQPVQEIEQPTIEIEDVIIDTNQKVTEILKLLDAYLRLKLR